MSEEKEPRGLFVGLVVGFLLGILVIVSVVFFAFPRLRHEVSTPSTTPSWGPPETRQTLELKAKQVLRLDHAMGVALVEVNPVAGGKASYRWRFLGKGQTNELVGKGDVFEKYDKKRTGLNSFSLTDMGSVLKIVAEPIEVDWSYSGPHTSYIYFEPARVKAQILFDQAFDTASLTNN